MNHRKQPTCSLTRILSISFLMVAAYSSAVDAQSVCLPSPRLLTTMPMGGQVGTQVEVTISGQHLEDIEELLFSTSKIRAVPKLDENGRAVPNHFTVNIAADCPLGIHEARVMSRLGISTARVFTVGSTVEAVQTQSSTTVATAMELDLNSICNATLPARGVNHYKFVAQKGQRILVDCAAKGIDSKVNPVLVVADSEGRDLIVERRGGAIDFTADKDATYVIKVHDLTFNGGAEYFYRLSLQNVAEDALMVRQPSTRAVSSFSWPPQGLAANAGQQESEPNNQLEQAQKISLPCDIAGSFFPAADVDSYEFTAKKGEEWWIEVASERLGRPTDPSVVVQRIVTEGSETKLVDVVELSDIASPIKRSSNGYSYDGPPYNSGSTDVLGKVTIPEDGRYRMQVLDLFGGTRNDPRNVYRLIARQAQPDFAVVSWALHMNLRNGDRNALSKPIALRGGSTMALEVVVVRRDGFAGEIQLEMDGLPEGVTATGMPIPAGQTRGIMLLTASENAPRGLTFTRFNGRAVIGGQEVIRPCHMASMAWPVPNAWSEIPAPRLLVNIPVSVGGSEFAALTIAAKEDKVWEVQAGGKLTIPLTHTRRGEFSGPTLGLSTFGVTFARTPKFEVSLNAEQSEVTLNLATLKPAPGDYKIAFYGSAVAKYQYNPTAVLTADLALKKAQMAAKTAAPEEKAAADAAVAAATKRLADVKRQAQPRDIVDIYVSNPITIRVHAAESPKKP